MFDNNFGNPKVQGIKEIVLPDPVSYVPQAVGWWILLGIIGLLLVWWVYRRYIQWCGNRYRRQALMELDSVRSPDEFPLWLQYRL
ncbi:MAG: DUF4381 family protein [Planctomycetota bacterium]|jgi:hypothetical protein